MLSFLLVADVQTNPQEPTQKSDTNLVQTKETELSLPNNFASDPNNTEMIDSSNLMFSTTSPGQDMNSFASLPSITSKTNCTQDIDSSGILPKSPKLDAIVSSVVLQNSDVNSMQPMDLSASSSKSPELATDLNAERPGSKPSISQVSKTLSSSLAQARKIAGQRRKRVKSHSPVPLVEIAQAGDQPELKKRKTSNEKHQPNGRRKRLQSFGEAEAANLCSSTQPPAIKLAAIMRRADTNITDAELPALNTMREESQSSVVLPAIINSEEILVSGVVVPESTASHCLNRQVNSVCPEEIPASYTSCESNQQQQSEQTSSSSSLTTSQDQSTSLTAQGIIFVNCKLRLQTCLGQRHKVRRRGCSIICCDKRQFCEGS